MTVFEICAVIYIICCVINVLNGWKHSNASLWQMSSEQAELQRLRADRFQQQLKSGLLDHLIKKEDKNE